MVVYHYRSLSQSDSEGSVSSGETLHALPAPVKCRWESCGEWFSQLELLAGHVTTKHAVPGKGGLFYCHWESCNRANRGFNARYKMLVHMRTHTNEKPHHCFQCDKSFSRAENLKIHARSHTGERPYVCPVAGCGKAYSNSSDRFKHTRTHSVDKPYVCKVAGCPKRYTDPSSLRKHVKTYRHYPNSNLKVSKMDVEDESWKTDLEKRLATPSPEVGRPGYTPCEETRTSPVIAAARYDRDILLIPNRTAYDNQKSDSEQLCLRMIPNQLHLTRHVQEDRELMVSSQRFNEELRHGITPQIYTAELPVQSVSPSYEADQLRHGITPQCRLADYATTIRLEAALNPSPTSPHPYYLLYNSYMDASYPHEQESPLDLSLHH